MVQLISKLMVYQTSAIKLSFWQPKATSKEAEQYLGTITVATDAQGVAKANWKPSVKVASITANVTDRFGATSELGFVQVK